MVSPKTLWSFQSAPVKLCRSGLLVRSSSIVRGTRGVWAFGPSVGEWSPTPLTAFPGGTVTRTSVLPVVEGVAGCSNSNATISCFRPSSTFSRSTAGCLAPTAPDTVDWCVNGCMLGELLGSVAAEAPGG